MNYGLAMDRSPGVSVSPRVKRAYVAATAGYFVAAGGFAVAQVWVVAGAFSAMGVAMVGAARQMRAAERD